jgi:hypothetical protein
MDRHGPGESLRLPPFFAQGLMKLRWSLEARDWVLSDDSYSNFLPSLCVARPRQGQPEGLRAERSDGRNVSRRAASLDEHLGGRPPVKR